MKLRTRKVSGNEVAELYVTATPGSDLSAESQATEVFDAVGQFLREEGGRLVEERVFGTQQALTTAGPIRSKVYSDLDDGVGPAWLAVPEGLTGPLAGVQVHAVAGCGSPEVITSDGMPCGRALRAAGAGLVTLSNIRAGEGKDAAAQAWAMLEKAESVLGQVGLDMFTVPRTWMWLSNILRWYDDFNKVRNEFFGQRGLIANGDTDRMPASTGIGIGPANGKVCAMDLAAVQSPAGSIEYFNAGGNQESPLKYGSAFSRACKARTPAGMTVFVSGTASIAPDGRTAYVGDASAQIKYTIENVQAVLREMGCSDRDVVQAISYCKTAEVERLFQKEWAGLDWPNLTAIGDVCRDDLLFEMEATALVPEAGSTD